MPRPKKQIVIDIEKLITDLASYQHSKSEIARLLDISVDTLDRRYAEVYAKGKDSGRSRLRKMMFEQAMGGSTTMAIFLAKNWLGMSDKQSVELSGPEGEPIKTSSVGNLTDEQLRNLESIRIALERAPGTSGDKDGAGQETLQ
ncbi:MAG: hypothetical protein J0H49_10725 [Acidobacteria bacterium]|nr:hypothetical protein [Acidobacteriota bacterium]